MDTQTKEVSCYKQIASRQNVAEDIEDNEDGMGTQGQKYYG